MKKKKKRLKENDSFQSKITFLSRFAKCINPRTPRNFLAHPVTIILEASRNSLIGDLHKVLVGANKNTRKLFRGVYIYAFNTLSLTPVTHYVPGNCTGNMSRCAFIKSA